MSLRVWYRWLLWSVLIVTIWACAQQASPQGGPRDEVPPEVARTDPPTGTLRFRDEKVTFYFNETIRKPTYDKEIFVSPLIERPDVRLSDNAKRLTIKFNGDLRPATTYIITLNELKDANEGNSLKESYLLAFSTGDQLDSAMLRGRILTPNLGEPAKDMIVLLFDPDSIREQDYLLKRPAYLTKANDQGEFTFLFLRQAPYRLLALKDEDQSNSYSLATEQIAISLDTLIIPTERIPIEIPTSSLSSDSTLVDSSRIDSVPPLSDSLRVDSPLVDDKTSKDSLPVDSLSLQRDSTLTLTDSILTDSASRQDENILKLLAFIPDETAPRIRSYDFFAERTLALKLTEFPRLDSLDAWLTDTLLADSARPQAMTVYKDQQDVWLLVGVDREPPLQIHLRELGDSLGNVNDTVLLVSPERIVSREKPLLIPPEVRADLQAWRILLPRLWGDSLTDVVQVTDTATGDNQRKLGFSVEKDGFYANILLDSVPDVTAPYLLGVLGKAGVKDTANHDSLYRYKLQWFNSEEYGTLSGHVQIDSNYTGGLVLQLLDPEGNVVRTNTDTTFAYRYLKAGEYSFRAILDEDRNGVYTPGALNPLRWPERTYTVREKVTIRGNWDFEDHLVIVLTTDEAAKQSPAIPTDSEGDAPAGEEGFPLDGEGGPPSGLLPQTRKEPLPARRN